MTLHCDSANKILSAHIWKTSFFTYTYPSLVDPYPCRRDYNSEEPESTYMGNRGPGMYIWKIGEVSRKEVCAAGWL